MPILINSSFRNKIIVCVPLTCFLFLSGCGTVSYYGQSVIGHSQLMLARQSVEKLLADTSTSKELKANLLLAKDLRRYSIESLMLPDNGSYTDYVDLAREFPVWTVVAAEEFSVEPKTWCYPIIGCAGYRGYYSEQAAGDYAQALQKKDLETTVGGAGAYSTLGWFNDPLLPSMMRYGVADLAETLFHELAHQVVYIKNNTAFNEAFATAVGEQGTYLWLRDNRPDLLADYTARLLARNDFSLLLLATKESLSKLYASNLSFAEKRRTKQIILGSLREQYSILKTKNWQGIEWFDRWFETPINNARLAAFASYRDQVPDFVKLLNDCNSKFSKFYASVEKAGKEGAAATVPKRCVVL